MEPIGSIAHRFAALGPFRHAAGFDLELAVENRQALDGTALMAFRIEDAAGLGADIIPLQPLDRAHPADEMQDRPASPFVMRFLGGAARFSARVSNRRAVIKGRTTKIAVPDGVSGEIAVYCRPWDLRIVPRESADVMGTVHAIRRVGATRRVEIDIDECGRVEVQAEPSWRPNPGAEIGVSIERARAFANPAVCDRDRPRPLMRRSHEPGGCPADD
jgi:hypothetical protein